MIFFVKYFKQLVFIVWVCNATFNNMSGICRRSFLLVEDTGVKRGVDRSVTSDWQTLFFIKLYRVHLDMCWNRTHNCCSDRNWLHTTYVNVTTIRSHLPLSFLQHGSRNCISNVNPLYIWFRVISLLMSLIFLLKWNIIRNINFVSKSYTLTFYI